MKTIIFLISFLNITAFSQNAIELKFNSVYVGRNLSVSFTKNQQKFSYSAGVFCHFNKIDAIPTNTFYKNGAYSLSFIQRIGLEAGFEYFFYQNNFCSIGAFYNIQILNSNFKLIIWDAYLPLVEEPQSEFDYSYIKEERNYGPVLAIDNIIGLSLKNKITEKFYLKTKAGSGILYYDVNDSSLILVGTKNNHGVVFGSFFSIGLGYKLNKKSKEKVVE